MKEPLVSIIIVNWNGGEVFQKCLDSLIKIKYPNWELIIVDNGSSDGSEKKAIGFKNLKLIKNLSNFGFAKANNQGFAVSKGKCILFLNNDTMVEPDLLKVLVSKMESDPSIGVIQPKIFLMDTPNYLDNAGTFLTKTGFLEHWGFMEKDSKEFGSEREIFSAKGACMLVRREIIQKVGLFDEKFVSYFEESDFCWRVWLAGFKVLYYPKAKIFHKLGFASKKMEQVNINYHSFKNRISSLFKNLENGNLLFILVPHLAILKLLAFYYLLRFHFKKVWMLWHAILWNLINLPGLIKKRKMIQAYRVKGDDELFRVILKKTNYTGMLSHFLKVEKNLK